MVPLLMDFLYALGTHPAIIVLEPDAIGLLGTCGEHGFLNNMKLALTKIQGQSPTQQLNQLTTGVSNLKDIVLNTSNYRKTTEMSILCAKYANASNGKYKCLIDTSRQVISNEPTL